MSQSQSSQGDRSPNTSNVGRDVNIDSPTMNVHGGQGYQQGENQGKIYNATNITIQNYYYQEETKIAPSELAESDRALPCPYRGLFHFGPHDADLFFGRDIFIEELDRATKHRNFIPVLGASGSGKSSVILAGLVPKLQEEGHWQFTHFRPGSDPFYALAEALVPLYRLDADSTDRITQADKLAQSLQNGMPLSRVLSTIQNNHPQDRVLIVGDQFEEVYTLCNDEKVRRQFLDCLLDGLETENSLSSSPVVWAIAMRADFLGNALLYPAFADVLQNPVMLRSMNREELTEAIAKPASLKVTFEVGLVERILNDVEEQPGNLPLLEFALTELWSKRTGGELTHQIYEEIEGVEGALARHADEKYGSLTEAEKENVRRIFIQLVRPGEETEDTRRIAVKTELGEESWLLVKQLADARLVVTSRNAARQETVEVVHEALIRNWGELREWMKIDRVFRAWQERLRSLQRYWEESDRDSGLLLRGAALAEAEERLQERPEELMAEAEFIRLSIGDRERLEKEREARRRRDLRTAWGIAIGSLVAVVISSGLGWMAWERTQQAQSRERLAKIRQLAAQSEWLRDRYVSSYDTGVLLAAESYNLMAENNLEMVEVDTALRSILKFLPQQIAHISHQNSVTDVSFSPDGKYVATASHDGTARISRTENGEEIARIDQKSLVLAVSFSPDGKYVATASRDGTARINHTENGEEIARIDHKDVVLAVSFSPDGKYVATASSDSTARISRTENGEEIARIDHRSGSIVWDVSFSPDGKYVATASEDQTARISRTENGELIARINHGFTVRAVSFSPDGKYVATASDDGTVRISHTENGELITRIDHEGPVWDVSFSPDGKYVASHDGTARISRTENGELIARIDHGNISAVSFSPDGKYVATASPDNTARISRTENGELITRIDHEDGVNAVSFSPDGKYFATASSDNTARISHTENEELITRIDHEDGVNAVSFSPDGKYVATASRDGTARISRTENGELITRIDHKSTVWGVSFSPDGKYVATANSDNTARISRIDTGKEIVRILHRNRGSVYAVSFSPDGKYVATANSDNTASISRTDTGEEIAHINHEYAVRDVSFSPDGKYVATASDDGTARISRTENGELITRIDHESTVWGVSFSPNGKYVATASSDNTARVSHTENGETIARIDHEDDVLKISFSPDGKYVATASSDNTARISRTENGETIARIDQKSPVKDVSFSPDGKYVVTASLDNTARISYAKSAPLWITVCSGISRNLTAIEWERYVDADLLTYRRTCPDRPVHESVTRRALQWVTEDKNKALKLLRHIAKIDDNADLNPDTEERDRDPKAIIKQILSSIESDKQP